PRQLSRPVHCPCCLPAAGRAAGPAGTPASPRTARIPRAGLQWERRRLMGTHVERANDPVARPVGAPPFELVAIASSAGGLAALTSVLSGLPGAFPAAVVLVQHLAPRHRTLLADMLGGERGLGG